MSGPQQCAVTSSQGPAKDLRRPSRMTRDACACVLVRVCVYVRARVHARVCACAFAWAPADGITHLDWAVLYSSMRACFIRLRSGWGSDGNIYNVLRGLKHFWKPSGTKRPTIGLVRLRNCWVTTRRRGDPAIPTHPLFLRKRFASAILQEFVAEGLFFKKNKLKKLTSLTE